MYTAITERGRDFFKGYITFLLLLRTASGNVHRSFTGPDSTTPSQLHTAFQDLPRAHLTVVNLQLPKVPWAGFHSAVELIICILYVLHVNVNVWLVSKGLSRPTSPWGVVDPSQTSRRFDTRYYVLTPLDASTMQAVFFFFKFSKISEQNLSLSNPYSPSKKEKTKRNKKKENEVPPLLYYENKHRHDRHLWSYRWDHWFYQWRRALQTPLTGSWDSDLSLQGGRMTLSLWSRRL